VVLVLFNRPDLINEVMSPVRKYGPDRIYLIADGPRADRSGERALCNAARAAAAGSIDWRCEVSCHFSDSNLGCRNRVVSGLDAVFEHESEAVILEDDTVAHDDFLPYCERMLEAHRDDERVFSITGTKLFSQMGQQKSAFLSRFTHIWGWATWRRSWLRYDRELRCLGNGELRARLQSMLPSRHVRHWERVLADVQAGRIDTWDYQLQASAWLADGFCLTPPRNLVSNRGFRPDATHTAKPGLFAEMRTYSLAASAVAYRGQSPSYEWLFQNMFHNPSRPLAWVRAWLALWARAGRRPALPPTGVGWEAAKQPS
jgi:hypothetical protein